MSRTKVLSVFGTRPEAIKMAPVVLALRAADDLDDVICVTAQHRDMLDQVLDLFDITPEHDLDVMKPGQDLFDVTAKVLLGLRDVLRQERPDVVLVHGDTATCFTASLAAFYERIPVGHVEAGLRTGDLSAPFPEEANRVLTDKVTTLHFAPTPHSAQVLRDEGAPEAGLFVTGNTVIDALLMVRDRMRARPLESFREAWGPAFEAAAGEGRMVLVTGHRRESFGGGFERICHAIRTLAERFPEAAFVYPVHLNPNVQKPVHEHLSGLANVHLLRPLDYAPFVRLMDRADVILTDSGGIQEEAPSLGKPVLVMRDVTERMEGVEAGTVKLVGTDVDAIVGHVTTLLTDEAAYRAMAEAHNPYGDGKAAARILDAIRAWRDRAPA